MPDERIASLGQALQGKYSASHLAHEPLYRMALIPFMATNLLLPALGIARAALELFMDKVPDRSIAFTWHEKQDEAAVTHLQLGEVSAKIDAAELMVRHCFDELEVAAALATAGDTIMPLKQRARIRRDSGFATQLIWEAMDMLAGASGGSFARTGNRMSHLWRDARVASLHGGVCPSTNLELFGRILCGKEPNTRLV